MKLTKGQKLGEWRDGVPSLFVLSEIGPTLGVWASVYISEIKYIIVIIIGVFVVVIMENTSLAI